MLFLSGILLIGILVGDSYGKMAPNYAMPPPDSLDQSDGFHRLWRQVVYQDIKIFNNISYLYVDNLVTNTQVRFQIMIDKYVPVVHDNLARTVYVVIKDSIQQRIFVIKAYLNTEKKKFVIENYFSRTGYSLVTGDGNGTVLLSDYDKNLGLVNYTRKVPQVLIKDSYGNQFIGSTDYQKTFYYPIFNETKSNLPIVFDELTGEGLLVHRRTNDTDLKFYGLEYDMDGNWRALVSKDAKRFVQKNKLMGDLVFSPNIKPKNTFVKNTYTLTSIPGTSDKAVKRNFEQYLEIDEEGKATLASVDPILYSVFRYPVENVNNLPVVYDFFNQSAYLVTPKGLSKLYNHDITYVIEDKTSNTGYNSVTADSSGKLTFKAYNQKTQDLKPLTKEYSYSIIRDPTDSKIFTVTYNGPFFNETDNPFNFIYESRDSVYNMPVVYNHLSGQAFLVAFTDRFYYGLEEPSPGNFVALDRFTSQRKTFKILENGDVDIKLV